KNGCLQPWKDKRVPDELPLPSKSSAALFVVEAAHSAPPILWRDRIPESQLCLVGFRGGGSLGRAGV
ncbi:unnamed protein product, partial [Urochloa humidicola]